tara:strand:+ start:236 stop:670 length:435 start_codon:yes stop_codon:yes gene_type:complete
MTKLTKNQSTKLSNVVVLDSKALTAIANGEKVFDNRTNNPGRPVNKKSARYKRLAKQAKYARVLSKFTQGSKFKLNKEKSQTYRFSASKGKYITGVGGCIVECVFGSHVCNIDYVGRTKATGYAFVFDKKVNVELNLKTLQFVS